MPRRPARLAEPERRTRVTQDGLTDKQRKWMASVRATLESSTGRTLAEWVEIARTCPETAPRARVRWLKETHGLGQNYAMLVLGTLDKEGGGHFVRAPEAMRSALWTDPAAASILAALQSAVDTLPHVVTGHRKTFTSWSRNNAFAAARPVRGGVRLGLALEPSADPWLEERGRESWSERLKGALVLASPDQVDERLSPLLRAAWERS